MNKVIKISKVKESKYETVDMLGQEFQEFLDQMPLQMVVVIVEFPTVSRYPR